MTTINEFLPVYLEGESISTPKIKTAREREYESAQRAASGDVAAFEEIYWQHHRRVFSICLRMIKNAATAEDITQQVFLTLFRKIGHFRGDAAFTTWLHRMTVNQVLMYFRADKSRKEDITENGEMPENEFARRNKPNDANQIVERFQLNQAIAELPTGYRKIFILHDVQGFEHEEIARMLGCAAGTSKSQLHKARRKLRRLLLPDRGSVETISEATASA